MTEREMSNVEHVKLWIEALESGEFLQGEGCLAPIDEDDVQRHCCLGVAVEVVNRTTGDNGDDWGSRGDWSELLGVQRFYGFANSDTDRPTSPVYEPTLPVGPSERLTCAEANDDLKLTFGQIADLLRYDYNIPKEDDAQADL